MNGLRLWLAIGGINILLALALGAIGAHAVAEPHQSAFSKAVFHQMTQGLGLLAMALAHDRFPGQRLLGWSPWLLLAGMIGFCGGIYLRALADLDSLGPVIPTGGLLMMLAWLLFVIGAFKRLPG